MIRPPIRIALGTTRVEREAGKGSGLSDDALQHNRDLASRTSVRCIAALAVRNGETVRVGHSHIDEPDNRSSWPPPSSGPQHTSRTLTPWTCEDINTQGEPTADWDAPINTEDRTSRQFRTPLTRTIIHLHAANDQTCLVYPALSRSRAGQLGAYVPWRVTPDAMFSPPMAKKDASPIRLPLQQERSGMHPRSCSPRPGRQIAGWERTSAPRAYGSPDRGGSECPGELFHGAGTYVFTRRRARAD